jgi:hypothetical protein
MVLGTAVVRGSGGGTGRARLVHATPALGKGVRTLTVRYLGSKTVSASATTAKIRIR